MIVVLAAVGLAVALVVLCIVGVASMLMLMPDFGLVVLCIAGVCAAILWSEDQLEKLGARDPHNRRKGN